MEGSDIGHQLLQIILLSGRGGRGGGGEVVLNTLPVYSVHP